MKTSVATRQQSPVRWHTAVTILLAVSLGTTALAPVVRAQSAPRRNTLGDQAAVTIAPANRLQRDAASPELAVFPITSDVMYSVSSGLPTNEADATDSAGTSAGTVVEKLI